MTTINLGRVRPVYKERGTQLRPTKPTTLCSTKEALTSHFKTCPPTMCPQRRRPIGFCSAQKAKKVIRAIRGQQEVRVLREAAVQHLPQQYLAQATSLGQTTKALPILRPSTLKARRVIRVLTEYKVCKARRERKGRRVIPATSI